MTLYSAERKHVVRHVRSEDGNQMLMCRYLVRGQIANGGSMAAVNHDPLHMLGDGQHRRG